MGKRKYGDVTGSFIFIYYFLFVLLENVVVKERKELSEHRRDTLQRNDLGVNWWFIPENKIQKI